MSRRYGHCDPRECSDSSEEDHCKCRRKITDKEKIKNLKRDVKDLKETVRNLEEKVSKLTDIIDEMIKYQPESDAVKDLETDFYKRAKK